MAINVNLRIVGLYFNETVIINDKTNLTVQEVVDEYIRLHPNLNVAGGLEYSLFQSGSDSFVTSFTYNYDGIYNFDASSGAKVIPPDGKTLGNITRPAGLYRLSEDLEDQFSDKSIGLVWQYYVTTKNGKPKSKTPVSRGFQPFGKNFGSYNLANGDIITWRLVAIARSPNT